MLHKAYILFGSLVLISLGGCFSEPIKGCVVTEKYFAPGDKWMEDCNNCYCADGQDFCTRKDCHQIADSPLCRFLEIGKCQDDFIKTQCKNLCRSKLDPKICEHIKADMCLESAVLTMCPIKCPRLSVDTDNEGNATEATGKAGLFDAADPILAIVTDIEGKAPKPTGRAGFFDRVDPILAIDIDGKAPKQTEKAGFFNPVEPILAIGHHTYCGPYSKHYSNQQCKEIGIWNDVTVEKCEYHCTNTPFCTAFNWSGQRGRGGDTVLTCVLKKCGLARDGITPPMPRRFDPEWVSFSKNKPRETPSCKNLHGEF